MQFCFHQSSCQSCSEREEELHPTHPIQSTTALGHNKIRNSVVRGSGSSHNTFPWRQHQVLPLFSEINNPHPPVPLFPASSSCGDAADKWAPQEAGLVTISSHLQHLGVPRHWGTFIICAALWQRCSKARPPGLNLTKCPLSSPYLFSGRWASEVNLRPQFSSCVPWLWGIKHPFFFY